MEKLDDVDSMISCMRLSSKKMKDLSLCHVLLKQESSFEEPIRRMSVNRVSYSALKGCKDKNIHSLLLFNLDEFPMSFIGVFFWGGGGVAEFKLLKVMDFEAAPLDHIPKDVGSLFHLRCLSLRNIKLKKTSKINRKVAKFGDFRSKVIPSV